MPNRILREGIITSETINSLNWAEEVFYRRLLSVVDDYGRFHGNPSLLRAACYPLQLNKVTDSDIVKWLAATQKAGLVSVYAVEKKRYVEVSKFGQQVRAKTSKFPQLSSECVADAKHVPRTSKASAHLDVDVDVFEDVVDKPIASSAKALSAGSNGSAVAYIPLNDGTEFGVSEALKAELEKLYPAVDVSQTLNEIRGWNLAKPERRKTRRWVVAHITAWMSKEQNRGPKA